MCLWRWWLIIFLGGSALPFGRFLFLAGYISQELSSAVPSVAAWAGGSLPQPLAAPDVAALLAADDGTAVGLRDHAVVVVLARLGLRASEVAGLDQLSFALPETAQRTGGLVSGHRGAHQGQRGHPLRPPGGDLRAEHGRQT